MKKISAILNHNLPSYVKNEYDTFVDFISSYYKHLELEGDILHFTETYFENMDLDLADKLFIDNYLEEFARYIPKNKKISDADLLKYIYEFNLARGSLDSIRFLFTVIFADKAEIIFPRKYILKSSSNTWDGNIYIYISSINYLKNKNIKSLNIDESSVTVYGHSSNITYYVDEIVEEYNDGTKYIRLELSLPKTRKIKNDFIVDEFVTLKINEYTVIERVYGCIVDLDYSNTKNVNANSNITAITNGNGTGFYGKILGLEETELNRYSIINSGTGYKLGDYLKSPKESSGVGFIGEVIEIDVDGAIQKIQIIKNGKSYNKSILAIIDSENGTGAQIELTGDKIGRIKNIIIDYCGIQYKPTDNIQILLDGVVNTDIQPIIGCIFNEPKTYKNTNDIPSVNSIIQDSFYYQTYSYAIKSKINPNKWIDLILNLVHPAGSELFSIWSHETVFTDSLLNLSTNTNYSDTTQLYSFNENEILNLTFSTIPYSLILDVQELNITILGLINNNNDNIVSEITII